MKRSWLLWLLPILALIVIAVYVGWIYRPLPVPEPTVMPPTATKTPRVTPIAPTATKIPTATATAVVGHPTAVVTATPLPLPTVTPTPMPTSTRAPVSLRGVHRVSAGNTLWGIACEWYGDMPLLPGANPLTPCTCWRGIAEHNSITPPQFIGRGWLIQVPEQCKW